MYKGPHLTLNFPFHSPVGQSWSQDNKVRSCESLRGLTVYLMLMPSLEVR